MRSSGDRQMANPSRGGDAKPRGSRASRAADAPCSWGMERPPDYREVVIVRRLFGASTEALIIVISYSASWPCQCSAPGGNGGGANQATAAQGRLASLRVSLTEHDGRQLGRLGHVQHLDDRHNDAVREPRVPPERDPGRGRDGRELRAIHHQPKLRPVLAVLDGRGRGRYTAYTTTPKRAVLGSTSFHVEPCDAPSKPKNERCGPESKAPACAVSTRSRLQGGSFRARYRWCT